MRNVGYYIRYILNKEAILILFWKSDYWEKFILGTTDWEKWILGKTVWENCPPTDKNLPVYSLRGNEKFVN